jgi:hypothetical protein
MRQSLQICSESVCIKVVFCDVNTVRGGELFKDVYPIKGLHNLRNSLNQRERLLLSPCDSDE